MQARDVMTADVVTLAPDTPIPDIVRLFRTRGIMTTPVITADADLDVEEIATLMVESKASSIPVLDGGKLVGIITYNDLIAHLEAVQVED
jgi:CBS domain-containing protein